MNRATTILVAIAAAATSVGPSAAGAQEAATDFAMALGRGQSGGVPPDSVRTTIGEVPEVIRDVLFLPPNARLLGSVRGPSFVTVYAATDLSPDSIRRLYGSELRARDWLPRGLHGGVARAARDRHSGYYCRSGWRLSIHVIPVAGGPNDLHLSYYRDPCEREPDMAAANLVPPLSPPDGTVVWGSRCASPGSVVGGPFPIDNAPPPDSLVAHYGRQLEAVGWWPAPVDPATYAASWERTGQNGERVVTMLIGAVDPHQPQCHVLMSSTIVR